MSILVDTHSHLSLDDFSSDRDEVIVRAQKSGVSYIVDVGIDIDNSRLAVELAERYGFIYASCGIHPNSTRGFNDDSIKMLESLIMSSKHVVAVGETGLDYYRKFAPKDLQERVFRHHIELAMKLGLPLIIHIREAFDDAIRILSEYKGNLRGIFHSFSGGVKECKWAMENGFLIGINGTITFSKRTPSYMSVLKPSSIVLETDAPYLAPHPLRGRRNEPSYIVHTAETLARIMGLELDELANITTKNALELFGIWHEGEAYLKQGGKFKNDFEPSKAFGQVFLVKPDIAHRIAELAQVKDKVVVEIGCGRGELTEHLVKMARLVVGVEIDRRFWRFLEERFKKNFKLIKGDFLKVRLRDFFDEGRLVVVGNIPYSKTTPILFHIAKQNNISESCILMLQKEAARRIFAHPRKKEYGPLPIVVQNYFTHRIIMDVPRNFFYPVPDVDSVLVSLKTRDFPIVSGISFENFLSFLELAFATRRKTLVNSLKSRWSPEIVEPIIEKLGLPKTVRAEQLTIAELGEIAKELFNVLE